MTGIKITPNNNHAPVFQKKYGLLVIMLLYVVMAIIVLGANPFKGETSAPVKLLANYSGWSSHDFADGGVHPERSDILDSFIPQWIILKQQIKAGDSALWNPVAGKPGVIDFTGGVLTPSYLAFLLIDEHWLGFYIASLLKLVIAGLGMYLFLRIFTHPYAAFFGGVVFALSGFNAAWFYWQHVLTSAWIAWLMWATAGWVYYKTYRWLLAVVLTTIMLILGGFPAVAAYALYAASILFVVLKLYQRVKVKELIQEGLLYLLAILSAFMLLAIPLLSLVETLSLTNLSYRNGGTALKFPDDLKLLYDAYIYSIPRVERTPFVGIVAVLLSALAVMLFLARKIVCKVKPLFVFAFIVLVASLSIAYAVLPQEFIRSIPAIGGSPWSRIVVLTDFSMAVLAAIGLHQVLMFMESGSVSKLNKKAVMLVVILLVSFQFHDQYKLFRKFNTPASKMDFFPATPAVNYVKDTIGENEGVIADENFLISGTLGAYSLKEWFNHGFKSDVEKGVLKKLAINPFRTATSTVISQGSIIYDAELHAKLGIKYVLAGTEKLLYSQRHVDNKPWPFMLNEPVTQYFQINESSIVSAIGLVMATYHAKHSPVDAYLRLKDDNGLILATSTIKSTQIFDNRNAVFHFDQALRLSPGQYGFEIGLIDATDEAKVTAWYTEKPDNKSDTLNSKNKTVSGSFLYKIYSDITPELDDKWLVHKFPGEKVVVIENILTPAGVYFIDALGDEANRADGGVKIKSFLPDEIVINNKVMEDGYIVLPMRFYPGWRAYVNDSPVAVLRFMGIMPAIPVDGPSEIKFYYRPSYLNFGMTLMFLGLVLLWSLKFFVTKTTKETESNETHHPNSMSQRG